MTSVIIRIVLRYAAAALVAKGLLSADLGETLVADVDIVSAIEIGLGLASAAAVEGWYWLARRFGWEK